jgi:hypothetical protein
VLLPFALRARLSDAFARGVHAATDGLRAFVGELRAGIEADWAVHSAIPAKDTGIATTVLTPAKTDALYDEHTRGKGMAERADDILGFFPAATRTCSYEKQAGLSWRLRHGASTLAERMRDFAAVLLAPVGRRGILDIIEMDDVLVGSGTAARVLQDALSQARFWLPLAPGFLPRVESEGK